MSDSVDPYQQWLKASGHDDPPEHYRLLGLPLFESNPAVITNALGQRVVQLKSRANGPDAALVQRLLGEVVKAGECLLRPAEKQAYDNALRGKAGQEQAMCERRPLVLRWRPSLRLGKR